MTPDKSAADCQSLAEIRAQIDRIDQAMVELLVTRGSYVLAAARFKHSEAEVTAPQRVEQVIARVRALAEARGASADVVERVYRELIAAFTDAEREHWRQQ